jgi:putative serine protease PepD
VVANASSISVKLADGTVAKATLVGADASTDLAVIRISVPAGKLHPLRLGDSSSVSVGDGVVAIGNPFGLDDTVTTGIVSAVGREITSPNGTPIEDAIQTDAAINHGNSGGPLFNLAGEVIGVTAQIESDSGGNDGVGFAIPSNTIRTVVARLLGGGTGST